MDHFTFQRQQLFARGYETSTQTGCDVAVCVFAPDGSLHAYHCGPTPRNSWNEVVGRIVAGGEPQFLTSGVNFYSNQSRVPEPMFPLMPSPNQNIHLNSLPNPLNNPLNDPLNHVNNPMANAGFNFTALPPIPPSSEPIKRKVGRPKKVREPEPKRPIGRPRIKNPLLPHELEAMIQKQKQRRQRGSETSSVAEDTPVPVTESGIASLLKFLNSQSSLQGSPNQFNASPLQSQFQLAQHDVASPNQPLSSNQTPQFNQTSQFHQTTPNALQQNSLEQNQQQNQQQQQQGEEEEDSDDSDFVGDERDTSASSSTLSSSDEEEEEPNKDSEEVDRILGDFVVDEPEVAPQVNLTAEDFQFVNIPWQAVAAAAVNPAADEAMQLENLLRSLAQQIPQHHIDAPPRPLSPNKIRKRKKRSNSTQQAPLPGFQNSPMMQNSHRDLVQILHSPLTAQDQMGNFLQALQSQMAPQQQNQQQNQ
jgi:hypothetical protein